MLISDIFLIGFSLENDLSAEEMLTGIINNIPKFPESAVHFDGSAGPKCAQSFQSYFSSPECQSSDF